MLKDHDQKHLGKEGVNFSSQPSGHTSSGQEVKHALEELGGTLLTGRKLMKELSQMQQEYLELKKQVCTPEPQLTSPGHCAGTGRVYCCQYLFNRNVGLVKADCKECSSS